MLTLICFGKVPIAVVMLGCVTLDVFNLDVPCARFFKIEGCLADNVDVSNWNEPSIPAVSFSRALSISCRHDQNLRMDFFGFISLGDIVMKKGKIH